MEPVCELCPNSGGIFKETDVGKWVHLICALYAPGKLTYQLPEHYNLNELWNENINHRKFTV